MLVRFLTGIILGPAALALIWFIPTNVAAGILAALWLLGAWEWSGFSRDAKIAVRVTYMAVVASGMALLWLFGQGVFAVACAVIWWVVATGWVMMYPKGLPADDDRTMMKWLVGLLVLLPSWLALVAIHGHREHGVALIYLFVLVWGADAGAYFAGRALGKTKLAPSVSPGKTWEGVGGAALTAVIFAIAGAILFKFQNAQFAGFILLSLLTVGISVVGDLTQSMFKRHADLKDSGKLFPGHGGVLDRFDSSMAAAPVFIVGLWLIEPSF